MQIKEITRKYILAGLVVFILVGLGIANVLASKQNQEFKNEDVLYQQSFQFYQTGNLEEAQLSISELLKRKPNSEIANYVAALIRASNAEYTSAAVLMQKTLDINPYNVEKPIFMLQFGEILFFAERYEDAKIVLSLCQESGWTPEDYPEYQKQVKDLLIEIENME